MLNAVSVHNSDNGGAQLYALHSVLLSEEIRVQIRALL